MSTSTVVTRNNKQIDIIDLADLWDALPTAHGLRAFCHLHGSDHQRSLSIDASGWGYCHACHRTVLVREYQPEIAQRLLDTHSRVFQRTPSAGSPLPVKRKTSHPSQPSCWQQEEVQALRALESRMQEALHVSPLAQGYLEERATPLELAFQQGLCWLPASLLSTPAGIGYRKVLWRWRERLLFPLTSEQGRGFIGRSLWQWQPGMDENAHKAVLSRPHAPRRWLKTNPAGFFGPAREAMSPFIILVEGGFDRLALLAAGFQSQEVCALVGTAASADCFGPQVIAAILGLDADAGGLKALSELSADLTASGRRVFPCPPDASDDWGKDVRRIGACEIPA